MKEDWGDLVCALSQVYSVDSLLEINPPDYYYLKTQNDNTSWLQVHPMISRNLFI